MTIQERQLHVHICIYLSNEFRNIEEICSDDVSSTLAHDFKLTIMSFYRLNIF